MTTNYEKIKSMNIDEMTEFFTDRSACDTCTCDLDENKCMAVGCKKGVKQYLESECE